MKQFFNNINSFIIIIATIITGGGARTNKLIVTSCIDNLTKGASGQAIQCMNIRMGLAENAGLL